VNRHHDEDIPRAAVPADVDAPDRIAYGLTARQLVILAVAALAGYGLFQALAQWLPPAVAAAALVPLAGAAAAAVLGRRDGLPMDVWLWAGLRFRRVPRLQTPGGTGAGGNGAVAGGREALVRTAAPAPVPAVLRLPAEAISPAGVLTLPGGTTAAVVACGTVNLALRTGAEQQALIAGFGRWLNSLQSPAQIVVSTQRVDLAAHATRLRTAAQAMTQPALSAAAADQATFLHQLAHTRDPLRRQVLVLVHGHTGRRGDATRQGQDTARALATLGLDARVLDAGGVTAALASAVDPYAPPVAGRRAAPDTTITSTSTSTSTSTRQPSMEE
jgi:hypothetical protein